MDLLRYFMLLRNNILINERNSMSAGKVLLVISVILFAFASFGFNPFGGLSLGWLGAAFLAGSFLV